MPSSVSDVAAGNLDGESGADLAVLINNGELWIYNGSASGLTGPEIHAINADELIVAEWFPLVGHDEIITADNNEFIDIYTLPIAATPAPDSLMVADVGETGFRDIAGRDLYDGPGTGDDGRVEIVLANDSTTHAPAHLLYDDGEPGGASFGTMASGRRVALGDIDEDNLMDVIWSNTTAVFMEESDIGGSGDLGDNVSPGTNINSIAVADFGGEVGEDIAVVSRDGGVETLNCYTMDGGEFGTPVTTTIGVYADSMVAADFDLDGNMDIVAADDDNWEVWLGSGTACGFTFGASGTVTNFANGIAVGDFNDDGKPDFAIGEGEGSDLVVVYSDR